MAEAAYQSKLKKAFEAQGWTVLKLSKLTVNGYPDLLLLHPARGVAFVEVKGKGGRLSKLQEYRIKTLTEKGFTALVSGPDDYADTLSALEIEQPK
jgi:hypothetical protein